MDYDCEIQKLDAQPGVLSGSCQRHHDSKPPDAQNVVVLVPKKVITALQAAQLLPTD
jgi:hypothetical protein